MTYEPRTKREAEYCALTARQKLFYTEACDRGATHDAAMEIALQR